MVRRRKLCQRITCLPKSWANRLDFAAHCALHKKAQRACNQDQGRPWRVREALASVNGCPVRPNVERGLHPVLLGDGWTVRRPPDMNGTLTEVADMADCECLVVRRKLQGPATANARVRPGR